jgi:hypothetical protein
MFTFATPSVTTKNGGGNNNVKVSGNQEYVSFKEKQK